MHNLVLFAHTSIALDKIQIELLDGMTRRLFPQILSLKIPGYNSDSTIVLNCNPEPLPITRMFVMDATIIGITDEYLTDQLVKDLGMLWREYVRAFQDSGAVIIFRLATSTKHLIWAPHGRENHL